MALSKRTYVGGTTKITAANLNDIQDSIIALEGKGITKEEVVNALEYTPAKASDIPTTDISANTAARHSHSNKNVLDNITEIASLSDGAITGSVNALVTKEVLDATSQLIMDEIPTSLKNPHALTFTGASSGTYDGSSAVTINIPSGSTDGEVVTTEEKFKVWGAQAASPAENDIVLSKRNGFYDKTGKLIATDAWCSNVNLIEITSDTIIYAKYLYDYINAYAISFFDANKSIISGIGGTGNTSVRITGYQTIPTGTKYVGVSLLYADPSMYVEFTIRKTTIVNSLKDRVAALEEKNSILESDFSDSLDLNYNTLSNSIDNGYIDTTGVFQSSSGWKTTEFFPINENDKLEVKLATYNTVSAISFF